MNFIKDAGLKTKIVAGFLFCIISGAIVLPIISALILGTDTIIKIFNLVGPRIVILAGAGLIGLACGVATFFWLVKKVILDRINMIMCGVDQLASGNLQTVFAEDSSDEIGILAANMNRMSASVSTTIDNILASSSTLMSTVDNLKVKAEQTAAGAVEQSGQAAEIAAAADEMSQTITMIAKNASMASDSSTEAMEIAESGKTITDSSVETINEVSATTKELTAMFNKLSSSVAEIGNILTVIKEIADQTNLLALNAAIEAARAGDQGRGFSVVADEVRKLAERTIKATAEISERINAVQADSAQTAKSMAGSSKGVIKAAGHIKNLNNVLQTIVESVQIVRDQITHIASAVEEQTASAEGVVRNIDNTSSIAKEIERMANETRAQIEGLTGMGDRLRRDVAGFTTSENKVMAAELAKTDHRIFMEKVRSCIRGEKVSTADLPECLSCSFGEWCKQQGADERTLAAPHRHIHDLAEKAITLCNAGKRKEAESVYKEMEKITEQIVSQLDRVKRGSS